MNTPYKYFTFFIALSNITCVNNNNNYIQPMYKNTWCATIHTPITLTNLLGNWERVLWKCSPALLSPTHITLVYKAMLLSLPYLHLY